MLTKKHTTETAEKKTSVLKNKKKKTEAVFEFSNFQDEIRVQAYYNYLDRMNKNIPGSEMSDWMDAEISIRSKMSTH